MSQASQNIKPVTPGYAPSCINNDAVFWLNASPETRALIQRTGGTASPNFTQDDRFAAEQAARAPAPAPKP